MFDLTNQRILSTGWAGPLFWVVTEADISIHLFDSTITFKGRQISIGEDVNPELRGEKISRVVITQESFSIELQSGKSLLVNSERHETARAFIKGSGDLHHIYQNGVYAQEAE